MIAAVVLLAGQVSGSVWQLPSSYVVQAEFLLFACGVVVVGLRPRWNPLGQVFPFLGVLEHRVAALAGEVTTQYIIRYIPDSVENKKLFRNINVKVNLLNVKVRARKGYYPYAP